MKNQTRRGFIKTSLLGGAGVMAFPHLLPSHIWAAEAKPKSCLTMGFIGMGTQSRRLLRAFLSQDTRVVAVCDVDKTRREDAKQRVDGFYAAQKSAGTSATGCAAYNDFRDLIASLSSILMCPGPRPPSSTRSGCGQKRQKASGSRRLP
jgi:hypothetical protein